MALSGHAELHCTCPLSGVKRTCRIALQISAYDPKRTLGRAILHSPTRRKVLGFSHCTRRGPHEGACNRAISSH
jgi:hypothetical protein